MPRLSRIDTFALDGVEARHVWVEADLRSGLPAFTVVGLADKAVREARERVRSALTNSGYVFPDGRITINLAPAYLRKVGPGFDLAAGASRSWRRVGSCPATRSRAAPWSASCR